MQGVGLFRSSWPHTAYVSSGNPLLGEACTPLALGRGRETQSLRSAPSKAARGGHKGKGALALLRHHAFQHPPILSREKPHCGFHCYCSAGLMRDLTLLLPELQQPCLLRDGVQLLESRQQVQGRLPATGHSLGLELTEDSSEPQRLFYT